MTGYYNRVYDLGWTMVGMDNSTKYPQITNITPEHVYNIQQATAQRQRKTKPGLSRPDSPTANKPQAPILSGHVKPINSIKPNKPKISNNKRGGGGGGGRKATSNPYAVLSVDNY